MRQLNARERGVLLLLMVIAALVCNPAFANAQWRLVWSDEFEGSAGTAPNASKWTYESGNHNGWGNNERQYYCAPDLTDQANCDLRNPNLRLDGHGNLVIEARKERPDGKWTSGRMNTRGLFSQAYGRFEARIKLPQGQGIWPAFWLLGANSRSEGWPKCGEIDIMENLGQEPSKIHGSMHGPGYSGAHPLTSSYVLPGTRTFADDFHIFAVEWEPNVVRFYVDDALYETQTPDNLPSGTRWVYDHPFYIILNLAVGGDWPKDPDDTTVSPATMLVDYVRVYAKDQVQH
jgi:beta-glucanase (GH16 family)